MRPVLFFSGRVAMADALHVQCLVDVFEEGESHDTVVRALVFDERRRAELRGAVVCAIGPRGVEDLVDAASCQHSAQMRVQITYKGESSLGRRAPPLISSLVRELG